MTKTPAMPSRHSLIRNERGDRQPFRHARLSGVHWNTPAAMSRPPFSVALVAVIVVESIAAWCNPHSANVATPENAVQTARYPRRKMVTGTYGRSAACRRWFTLRKARIMGAADGTIMATIITVHITKRSRTVVGPHSWRSSMTMPGISMAGIAALVWRRYNQARTTMAARQPPMINRSRRRIDSIKIYAFVQLKL